MSERTVEEIRLRHADFAAQYSPGPDWEPFNQTHQDRGFLLERIATLERQLEEARAHPDCLRCLDLERDRDADRAAVRALWSVSHITDVRNLDLPKEVWEAIARASQESS